jgi:Arc/MetJ family transcription regulator
MLSRMRTTLDLPDDLMNEAQRILGFKSKTDTVILSLTELVRKRRIDELKGLLGHVDLDIDIDRSRRRPKPERRGRRQTRRSAR